MAADLGDDVLWTFFPLVAGHRRLTGRVYYGPGLIYGVGLDWAMGAGR